MSKWIIGVVAVTFVAAILGMGSLFMSTAPFLDQQNNPAVQGAERAR